MPTAYISLIGCSSMAPTADTSCPVCIKTVLDFEEGVGCDGVCLRWCHTECINMSKSEYQRIQIIMLSGIAHVLIVCNPLIRLTT